MANKRAKIYERVQVEGRWTDRPVVLPKLKADGTLYLKDYREGKFRISWYEGKAKQWHRTVCSCLNDALRVKEEREWFLKNQNRPGVQDPKSAAGVNQRIAPEVTLGSARTLSQVLHLCTLTLGHSGFCTS